MTDKKPTLYDELYGDDEAWAKRRAQTLKAEERSKTIYKLEVAGCSFLDAVEIMDAGCDSEQALDMIKKGKTKSEIIAILKKNDSGVEPPSP